ncbi:Noc2-domain-containing protein [Schizophyllum commune H4-8]|uniref:Noc2-domain-containing protein n=1 Tax=Schizophyllum commune (strain H4-8 / FGSC 9210) TaxID=578458 RepID=D8QFJ0_SCHCM|nr:Noc2-domain-containing protein [Schizophyllum commune H4-8]KAI5887664.1 Noc2-domain-containing protein [Schizophyllum commune H4-8]
MGKATKATKKFISSGKLKKTIQDRKKHREIKKRFESRRGAKGKGKQGGGEVEDDDEEEREEEDASEGEEERGKGKGMTVDDFLGGGFMGSDDDEQDMEEGDAGSDASDDEDEIDDNASFASVDALDEEGKKHLIELSKLAEKDPEFFKYLQENDQELLDFNPDALENDDEDVMMEGEDEEAVKVPTLTKETLKGWQKAILQHRSIRALRRLHLAFRSAAHMNEDNQVVAWAIDSASVYNKLVVTTLRYTPVVLNHHVPYKTLANGKYKPPTQTPKFKALQKLILSYFLNAIHLMDQITDNEMLQLALTETAKVVPYVISSRKAVKLYLKKCLAIWSSGEDSVRIAAFLAIRHLASGTDNAVLDSILKGTYMSLVKSCKSTNPYTLPSITLMKNSASELFTLDHATAYQHAFSYIRQLAIHLRNSMKVKTKEAYKQVYNWQYVHSVDFWALVLAKACDADAEKAAGRESELRALIYPLTQVAVGAIRLMNNARSHPFHLHLIRSLLHLTKHTRTYIPLSPHLVPILTATLSPEKLKRSTLRPLDLELQIRAPQQYAKTRVYAEGVRDEAAFLLGEWLACPAVHASAAFPEVVVPVIVLLRKAVKGARDAGSVKTLLERVEEGAKWVEQRRRAAAFAPADTKAVALWETELEKKLEESPLVKYLKVQRKAREKRRKLVEKARKGENEVLEESD